VRGQTVMFIADACLGVEKLSFTDVFLYVMSLVTYWMGDCHYS